MQTRREFMKGAAALGLAAHLPLRETAAARHRLVVAPATVGVVGQAGPPTEVWSFGGDVPGPVFRRRQGERLEVAVENRLPVETTVHWHGVRVPNAMDGVPHVTQPPIAPGGRFDYAFELRDSGTYWYHPHGRSHEQVERGLAGVLVVEEKDPPLVDRDLVWLLDDWRLTREAAVDGNFGHPMDVTHAGRLGNTVTINGRIAESLALRAGERIRLRLVNAANARIFALEFEGHRPRIIAFDGQAVSPHEAERVTLAPGQRVDLVLDATGTPGARYAVNDRFYPRQQYKLIDLAYGTELLRDAPLASPVELAPNAIPEPDLAKARRVAVEFGGGMMDPKRRMRGDQVWFINGVAMTEDEGHSHAPFLELEAGESCVLAMLNDTRWPHPIHLHGHFFRVLSSPRREWRDTVLLMPGEAAEIAFVAEAPGGWMFHCHVLEHIAGGMMALLRVS